MALLDNVGRRADLVLASRLFQHVLGLDLSKRPLKTGEFANQLRDYEMVREFFTSSTVITLTDFMFIWLFIFVIYYIAGAVALVPAIAVVAVLIVGLALQVPLHRAVNKTQAEATHRHSILFEALTGSGDDQVLAGGGAVSAQVGAIHWPQRCNDRTLASYLVAGD